MIDGFDHTFATLWPATGAGDAVCPDERIVVFNGPRQVLPSAFDVTGLATGAVAVAAHAMARLHAARTGDEVATVTVDSIDACGAFRAEQLVVPEGWELPPLWDPLAGNYRSADGWIRLHTNYAHHRRAAVAVLGTDARERVARAVSRWSGDELEQAIVAAGGAAAVMRTRTEWLASPPGSATNHPRPLEFDERPSVGPPTWASASPDLPLTGVRVLDLTRVIAGPVATKALAAYGAEVLRIDPPGFEEVASLLPETTVGKRTAALDFEHPDERARFEQLVRGADALVLGYRPTALARYGMTDDWFLARNPDLILARLNAYGWRGPWRERRGFDSLVQMSCGIADGGAAACGSAEPVPLPAQALDHGSGWLLAAAIVRALERQLTDGVSTSIRGSLVGTANLLYELSTPISTAAAASADSPFLVDTTTAWGSARRAPFPARIHRLEPHWPHPAGPLGRHEPRWEERR